MGTSTLFFAFVGLLVCFVGIYKSIVAQLHAGKVGRVLLWSLIIGFWLCSHAIAFRLIENATRPEHIQFQTTTE